MKNILLSLSFIAFYFGYSQSVFTEWTFDGANNTSIPGGTSSPLPSTGSGTATLIGGTTATFAAGTTGSCSNSAGSCAWNTATYPAQGTLSGTAGVMFAVSTVGKSNIGVTFDHRASGTASRFARFEYSTDGGLTWTIAGTNNGLLSPHDTFGPYVVNLSSCTACNNNPNFRFRIVSIFSPFAFNENSTNTSPTGFFAPNTNYMRANADAKFPPDPGLGTGSYSTAGTWRFDNVKFWENASNLSVEDVAVSKEVIYFYPNPAKEGSYIQFSKKSTVNVFDIQGRLVKTVENSDKLDISGLSKGIYIIKFDGSTASKLVVE